MRSLVAGPLFHSHGEENRNVEGPKSAHVPFHDFLIFRLSVPWHVHHHHLLCQRVVSEHEVTLATSALQLLVLLPEVQQALLCGDLRNSNPAEAQFHPLTGER